MSDSPSRRPALLAAAILIAATLLLILPPIFGGSMAGRGAHDQLNFHDKAIRAFAEQWPRLELGDYLSATTPGYHIVLAAAVRAGLDSDLALRLLASLFTVGLIGTLGYWCGRRLGAWRAVVVCLPLAVSLYVVNAGAWLLPDNAGWWGVLAVLLLALRGRVDLWFYAGGGVVLALLVMFRQIHLWAAAPLWAAAWLGAGGTVGGTVGGAASTEHDAPRSARRAVGAPAAQALPAGAGEGAPLPPRLGLLELFTSPAQRIRGLAPALAAAIPAFVIVFIFYRLWGGLTPPTFQEMYRGEGDRLIVSPATPAFILSLLAIATCFFLGYITDTLAELRRRRRAWLIAAAVAGFLLGIVPETTYSVEDGRFSGIWNVVNRLPVIAGHTSPLIAILSCAGAVALLAWAAALPWRARWVLLASIVAFTAAQAAGGQLWQRYSEPFILILLPLMVCAAGHGAARSVYSQAGVGTGCHGHAELGYERAPAARLIRLWSIAGPLTLAAMLGALTVSKLLTEPSARDIEKTTLKERERAGAPLSAPPAEEP